MSRRAIVAAVLVAAVLLAATLIGVSLLAGGDDDASPARTSSATGPEPTIAATSLAMLRGVPHRGNALGAPDAPVILIEYADLQCPFCARFTKETLPLLVRRWVKPGRLRIEFRGISFLGDDSVEALRFALAAGDRGKLWEVVELLYENQGSETPAG